MRWLIDGMNVIGTRPDAWWRDRHRAMVGLVDLLERWVAHTGEDVTVVFEQPPRPPIRSSVIVVTHAPKPRRDSADDEIIRLLRELPEPGHVRVVTSDSWLGQRVRATGATVEAAAAFRSQLEEDEALIPETRYTRSGEVSIAYQVSGDGPLDLLFLPGWISQIEQLWEAPGNRRFLEGLTRFGRLIIFDSRGTGLSDHGLGSYSLEQDVADAVAVLDAAGSERAAVMTYAGGGLVGARLAAEQPQRIGALIMYASFARTTWAPDYDWAMTREEREGLTMEEFRTWGEPDSELTNRLAPSMTDDPALAAWVARVQRLTASPSEARTIVGTLADADVREVLPDIRIPTLVMHRPAEKVWDVRHSKYLAEHIPGARYVELAGADSLPFIGDSDDLVQEIEEFLTGGRRGTGVARDLLTVMFTDIVDATARAATLGDGHWRDLLSQHDALVRQQLLRFGGREVKTVGDGFLATFDGAPSNALRCALAITDAMRALGIQVRVGMHTGECELIGDDVGGMAVHIASRVTGLAAAGEVLVSGTVFGTVVGGPFEFADRGFHELKGVPGPWPLFSLAVRGTVEEPAQAPGAKAGS